jgi:hypothetical protein
VECRCNHDTHKDTWQEQTRSASFHCRSESKPSKSLRFILVTVSNFSSSLVLPLRKLSAYGQLQKRPRPPGRPPKRLVPNTSRDPTPRSVNPEKKSTKRQSLENLKSKRKMAALEKLPTELLIPIFLFSMNVDLPRASPIIAGKLSSPRIYVEAIINTFGPTWEYDYDLVKGDGRTRTPLAGDPKLQVCSTIVSRCPRSDRI